MNGFMSVRRDRRWPMLLRTTLCAVALTLVLPATALASPPSANTREAYSTSTTQATVEAAVNPDGQITHYQGAFALSSSEWCKSGGASGAPEGTTSSTALGHTEAGFYSVEVSLSGLTAGASYCAEVRVESGEGSAHGGQVTFTAGAPTTVTLEPISIGRTEVVLAAAIDPASQTTHFKLEVGPTGSEWCASHGASGSPSITGSSHELASADGTFHLTLVLRGGLTGGERYCYEFVAENATGISHGGQVTFTAGAPAVATIEASSVDSTTATIEGELESAEQATHYWVDYGKAGSSWCESEGASGAPEGSSAHTLLGSEDSEFHKVAVNLAGLASSTEYCAEILAENESGVSDGGQVTFKTASAPPPPPSYELTVSVEGTGSGAVNGPGISCPGSCSGSYEAGRRLTLAATPASGSTFVGWSGACAGAGYCEVAMSAAQHVTALFTQNPATGGGNSGGENPGGNPSPSGGNLPTEGGKGKPEGEVEAANQSRSLLLAASTIEVQSNGLALVKLECRGHSGCHGKLTLNVTQHRKGKGKHKAHTVTIGTVSCSLSAHQKTTVKIKLNAAGRSMLAAARGHLSARLSLLGLAGTAPAHAQIEKVKLVMRRG